MLANGRLGLLWGIFVLSQSEATDDFRDIEVGFFSFETFSRATLTRTLETQDGF
jgi:hypothetical protein